MLYFGVCILLTFIHVKAVIEFTQEPESQAVIFGYNIVLNCAAIEVSDVSPGTLSYTWYHNGNHLSTSVFSNHSLLIVDIQNDNLGNYSCHVTSQNGNETAISSPAVLIQAYIKPFVTSPSSISVTEGSVATLECLTGESAPPPEIRWEKDGLPVKTGTQYSARFGTHPFMIGQYYMQLVLDSKPKETGSYSCVAVNPTLGLEVRSIVVQVTVTATESRPYIDPDISQSSKVMSPQGQPLVINCGIDGFPKPLITWYKSLEVMVPDNRVSVLSNGSLYFMLLTTGDQGYYYCDGKNYLGQVRSAEIFVEVAYINLHFEQEPDSLYIIAGKSIALPCSPPTSHPPANVTWYKDNQPMKYRTGEHAVYIFDPANSIWDLFFTDIQKQDEGRYFCIASNNFAVPTSRTSKSADLQIGGAPVFIDPPVSSSVVKGNGIEMKCVVEGDPFPQITWLLDNVIVVPDQTLIMRNQNQELHMANVNKIREGVYTCRAVNTYGAAESTAYLKVLVPPVIVDFNKTAIVTADRELVLPCYVNGDPTPTIQWLKDSTEVVTSDRIVIDTSGLLVKKVELEDAGIYTCHAFNMAGSVVAMATVTVYMKPEFIKSPFDKTVIMGNPVTMECEVRGYPTPVIKWLYNGTNMLPPGTTISSEDNEIYIAMVAWSHVGLYICLASNTLGAVTHDGRLSVYVLPRIQAINGEPVVYQGHDLQLTCDVSGIPSPTVKWLHLGAVVLPSLEGRVSFPVPHRMVIKYMQLADTGEYQCQAENLAGKTELSITVSVIEPPVPPILTKAVSLTSTSVTLTWSPVTQKPNTLVSQFVVFYKTKIDADYKRFHITADSTDTQIVVTGLAPGTVYMFVVSSVNPAGEGGQSNVISTKTMDSGPSQPRNLQVLFSNSSLVTLEWEIPAETNGQIRKYQIWYKVKKDNSELLSLDVSNNVDKPSVTFSINNLDPFTLYEFKVRGATTEGVEDMWGELSNSVEIRTSSAAPVSVPQIEDVRTLSSRKVEIKWQQPPLETWNGENLQYRVFSTDLNFTSSTKQYTTSELFIVIDDLLPWRWYSFVLEVGNEAGWGLKRSDDIVAYTLPEAPSAAPSITKLTALPNQEMVINFKIPDDSTWNSDLTGIIVQYTDEVTTQINYIDDPQLSSVTIRKLLPWTEYKIRLAVYTDSVTSGDGPFSDWKPIRTTESAPGKVGNVNHQATPTSITLTWSPPSQPNGIIQHYVIQYQDIGTQEGDQSATSNVLLFKPTTGDSIGVAVLNDNIIRIQTNLTTVVLGNLSPGHRYDITVTAVNTAGLGEIFNYTVSTVSLPPQPEGTTTEGIMTTEVTTGNQFQSEENSILSPAVFGGIVAGAILVVMVIILVTCLCIKRKRQDQSRYVNSKNSDVFGNLQGDESLRKPPSGQTEERGSLRRIDFIGDTVQYGSNKTGEQISSNKASTLTIPGTKLLPTSDENSIKGIENPGYDKRKFEDTESIAVSMTLSSEDLFSQSASSLKRTNRMKSESAAAIAVMRNQRLPRMEKSMEDTENLLNHDSIVIFTERTAL